MFGICGVISFGVISVYMCIALKLYLCVYLCQNCQSHIPKNVLMFNSCMCSFKLGQPHINTLLQSVFNSAMAGGMKATHSNKSKSMRLPPKRKPSPDVDVEQLKERLHSYVERVGVKNAFNLYAYNNMPVSCAVDGFSLIRKEQLVALLVQASPMAVIKFSNLRDSCKYLEDTFGKELFSCFQVPAPLLAGKVADQLFVMLAHIRRVMGNADRWAEAFNRYSDDDLVSLKNLRDFMGENGFEFKGGSQAEPEVSTPPRLRQLAMQISEVSVDSLGIAKVPCHATKDPDNLSIFKESPMPVRKRPASVSPLKKPCAASSMVKAPLSMKAAATGDFAIMVGTLKLSGGKGQTYLQHTPKASAKKQLVVAVSAKMSVNRKDLASKIHAWIMKQKHPVTKSMAVTYRDKILAQGL